MKYLEIIELEKRTNIEDLYIIHFYKEGDWWRAYEWSSYLVTIFPNELDDKHKIKPTRKSLKGTEHGIIFIGLKLSSFEKYLPGIKVDNIEDEHIKIDVKDYINTIFDINSYYNNLITWKNNFKLKEEFKNENIDNNKNEVLITSNNTIFSIISEISSYQIENKTLIENTIFLSNIKNKINKLL